MLNIEKKYRIALFLFVCLSVRSIPIFVLKTYPTLSNFIVLFYSIIGLSFMKTFLYSKKTKGFFGGEIWWHDLRIFHSICYLMFVLLYIIKKKYYTEILVFDLLVSVLSVFLHY